MPDARRNRSRKQGRRVPFLDPKPKILVVCEGSNTEPQYLDGFQTACRNPRVTIEFAGEHGDPKYLVEVAKEYRNIADDRATRERDENLAYDSVWCVFDIDDHERVSDAKQMARDNRIDTAISNPCFELWLLLHFRENPGMQHRTRLRTMLKGFLPDFNKDVAFERFASGYTQAVVRATRMDEVAAADGESGRNPTTGVYKLTELIRGDGVLS